MYSTIAALILLASSYGAMTSRDIKALSRSDVQALQQGHGMGLALAAELNRYPGPKHVLELADVLKLSTAQREAVQKAHDDMKAAAMALGSEIVELERALDRGFASGAMDEARLRELTTAIAERQGKLRFVHLSAHLTTRAVLTPDQVKAYDVARGYGSDPQHHHAPSHHAAPGTGG